MHELQPAYANWLLGYDWDAYYTQTFKNRRNDGTNAAIACWYILENRLSWTRGFIAVETHRLGGVHLHCLLSDELLDWNNIPRATNELKHRFTSTKKYMDKAFGFSHISSARNQATVNLYCSKYVVKNNGDYFFLGHWANG